jgi:Chaperone of endosialidase
MQYNAQMGDFNARQAAQANLNQGLFQLGGSAMMMSDIRLKENIKPVGVMPNGLTLYSFEYVDEVKSHPLAGDGIHVGVMAQEVEQVFPYAVKTLDDGYKVVDYGLLP